MVAPPVRLLPSTRASQTLYQELLDYRKTDVHAEDNYILDLATPELLSREVEIGTGGAKTVTHPYAMFLSHGRFANAAIIETVMKNDAQAARLLPAVYRTPAPNGKMPLLFFAQREDWAKVEELVRSGVKLTHIEGGGNLMHEIATAKVPLPQSLRILLEERRDELAVMLGQLDKEGCTPYHRVRSNALLQWMLSLDGGKAVAITCNKPNLTGITATALLFHAHYDSEQPAIDAVRYGAVSDAESVRMALTALKHGICLERNRQTTLEQLGMHVFANCRGEQGAHERLDLMRRLHAQVHAWKYGKAPEKGAFEANLLKESAGLDNPDKPVIRAAFAIAAEAGIPINGVAYEDMGALSGQVKSNLLYDIMLLRPQLLEFWLSLRPEKNGPQDYRVSPDAALFALRYVGHSEPHKAYKEQMRRGGLLVNAGARVTRDARGDTPLMEVLRAKDVALASFFLRHNLISDNTDKGQALKELRGVLDPRPKATQAFAAKTPTELLHDMLDAWEKNEPIAEHAVHAPNSPVEKLKAPSFPSLQFQIMPFVPGFIPVPVIAAPKKKPVAALVHPQDWPDMQVQEVSEITPPSASMPPAKPFKAPANGKKTFHAA